MSKLVANLLAETLQAAAGQWPTHLVASTSSNITRRWAFRAGQPEDSIRARLAQPVPGLLVGDAALTPRFARGRDRDGGPQRQTMLHGKGDDPWEMMAENIP